MPLFAAIPAHALSFNFGWSNDNVDDTNIASGGAFPANLTVVGTLDINRNAGESFTNADVTNINILATSPQSSFTFTSFNGGGGTIAANGLSASITDIFVGDAINPAFGCLSSNCNNAQIGIRTIQNTPSFLVNYNSQANVQASFQLTEATPVPFEF